MNSGGTPRSTSSVESTAGPSPSDSPDGRTTGPSGLAPVPVSRFRARDSEKALPTADTSGPLFSSSSPSASLQWSLENRLRRILDVNGSPEYVLTWKPLDMPAGVPICQLRASARRTSVHDSGGWPTPNAGPQNDNNDSSWQERRRKAREKHGNNGFGLTLAMAVQLTRPEPSETNQDTGTDALETAACPPTAAAEASASTPTDAMDSPDIAGWQTPDAAAGHTRGWPVPPEKLEKRLKDSRQAHQVIAGWTTPMGRDYKDTPGMSQMRTNPIGTTRERNDHLPRQVAGIKGWNTPTANDSNVGKGYTRDRGDKEKPRLTNGGLMRSGSPAPTEKRGALNPQFSRWLMGFPTEWDSFVPTATR